MLSRPSFRPAFIFSINALILCDLSLTSFHLAECVLYSCVCSCPKILRNVFHLCFLKYHSHF